MGRFRLDTVWMLRSRTTSGMPIPSGSSADAPSEWHRRVKPIAPAKPDRRSQKIRRAEKAPDRWRANADVRPDRGPCRHVVLASLLRGLGRQPGHFRPGGANTGAPLLQHPFQLANERESVLQKHDFLRAGSGRALGRTCGSHHAWSPRYGLRLPATRLSFGRRFRFKASAGRRDRMTGRPAVRATAPSCGGARSEFPPRLFPTISPELAGRVHSWPPWSGSITKSCQASGVERWALKFKTKRSFYTKLMRVMRVGVSCRCANELQIRSRSWKDLSSRWRTWRRYAAPCA